MDALLLSGCPHRLRWPWLPLPLSAPRGGPSGLNPQTRRYQWQATLERIAEYEAQCQQRHRRFILATNVLDEHAYPAERLLSMISAMGSSIALQKVLDHQSEDRQTGQQHGSTIGRLGIVLDICVFDVKR